VPFQVLPWHVNPHSDDGHCAGRTGSLRGDRKSPRYLRRGGPAEGTTRRPPRGFRSMSNVVDLMTVRQARIAQQKERAANYRHCVEVARPQARRGVFEPQMAPPTVVCRGQGRADPDQQPRCSRGGGGCGSGGSRKRGAEGSPPSGRGIQHRAENQRCRRSSQFDRRREAARGLILDNARSRSHPRSQFPSRPRRSPKGHNLPSPATETSGRQGSNPARISVPSFAPSMDTMGQKSSLPQLTQSVS